MLVTALIVLLGGALVAGGFALVKMLWIFRQPVENPQLVQIAGFIAEGALAFLYKMYQVLLPVILIGAAFIWIAFRGAFQLTALAFVAGALFSAAAGFLGMRTATAANSRTTHAAQLGLNAALRTAFGGGSVTGLAVLTLALAGIGLLLGFGLWRWGVTALAFQQGSLNLMIGFSLGAAAFALFARVGGGIFTKAADVGADLVGKLEAGIPEDDHRNPAVIADNVGDNVGDLAGMAADLFSSFVAALTACLILAFPDTIDPNLQLQKLTAPLLLASLGVLTSLLGMVGIRVQAGQSVQRVINRGLLIAALSSAGGAFLFLPLWAGWVGLSWAGAVTVGLATALLVSAFTEQFTAQARPPVEAIVRASSTGPATNLITGMGQGMLSSLPIVACLFVAILTAQALAGLYGVALAALGMLLPMGLTMAISAYGPIADNAGGLAEMAEFPAKVRENTDTLDAVGNTTSAIGKGFAIASTALTAVVLLAAFRQNAGLILPIDLLDVRVTLGLLLGGMIPYIFASLNLTAVGKAALAMIEEVRRQFREKPGILEGTQAPDYKACVSISTGAALLEMILPGLLAVLSPIVAGYLGGIAMLLGLLCGASASGVVLALFMTNTGGAWDNAKKTLEGQGYKGTEAHKAAVVGDTVGDPFKDTAGPSLNILLKLMAMIALLLAPNLQDYWR